MVGFLEILKAVSLENRNEKKTKDWFVQAQTILHRFQGRGGLFFKPLPCNCYFLRYFFDSIFKMILSSKYQLLAGSAGAIITHPLPLLVSL